MGRVVEVSCQEPLVAWSTAEETAVRKMFAELDALPLCPPAGELSVVIVTLAQMRELHERYLGDPSPTDVITFPGDESSEDAGEICVCAEIAARESAARGEAFAEELTLYLVHGWLHLAGLGDKTVAEGAAMRAAEEAARAHLRSAGRVPPFQWCGRA